MVGWNLWAGFRRGPPAATSHDQAGASRSSNADHPLRRISRSRATMGRPRDRFFVAPEWTVPETRAECHFACEKVSCDDPPDRG